MLEFGEFVYARRRALRQVNSPKASDWLSQEDCERVECNGAFTGRQRAAVDEDEVVVLVSAFPLYENGDGVG